MSNYLENEIVSADIYAQYDTHAKRLLKDRKVLAFILIHCANEFHEYTLEEAMNAIEGEPQVSTVPVRPTEAIFGDNTESELPGEGLITFDIIFHAVTKDGERTKLYINVEAQKSFYPGYDLTTRAIVYPARIISQQMDVEYTADNYDGVKKVYSIWICFNAPDKNKQYQDVSDSIVKYEIKPEVIYKSDEAKQVFEGRYDLICTVLIRLGKRTIKSENKLIGMLSTLFSDKLTISERKHRLKEQYGFDISRDAEQEVNIMCNLSELIAEEAAAEAYEKAYEKAYKDRDKEMIEKKLRKGFTPEKIHKDDEYPMELIREVEREICSLA